MCDNCCCVLRKKSTVFPGFLSCWSKPLWIRIRVHPVRSLISLKFIDFSRFLPYVLVYFLLSKHAFLPFVVVLLWPIESGGQHNVDDEDASTLPWKSQTVILGTSRQRQWNQCGCCEKVFHSTESKRIREQVSALVETSLDLVLTAYIYIAICSSQQLTLVALISITVKIISLNDTYD